MLSKRENILKQLRDSAPAQALDKAIEVTDKFLEPSGKAWLANGLDEIRQAFVPGNTQIQPGNNPGLWGTITTGEATAERMGDLSLDDLRGYAAARAKEADQAMERGHTQEHERGLE
jgi:hypothetical protein